MNTVRFRWICFQCLRCTIQQFLRSVVDLRQLNRCYPFLSQRQLTERLAKIQCVERRARVVRCLRHADEDGWEVKENFEKQQLEEQEQEEEEEEEGHVGGQ